MPVLGRRPAVFLRNGAPAIVVSEHLRRDRGAMLLREPKKSYPAIVVDETPLTGERVVMFSIASSGEFPPDGPFFPVLVLEKSAKQGAIPYRARYLRHAINPEVVFDEKTQQVQLFWFWNSFTPLDRFNTAETCRRVSLKPVKTLAAGSYQTHPTDSYAPHVALQDLPDTVETYQVIGDLDLNAFADGVWGRAGILGLEMGRDEGLPEGMRWLGATVVLICARRPLTVEFTGNGSPTGGTEDSIVSLPEEFRAPYSNFSVESPAFYTLKVMAELVVGNEAYEVTWPGGLLELTLPADDSDQVYPIRYEGKVQFKTPLIDPNQKIRLNIKTLVDPLTYPDDERAAVYYQAAEVVLECFSVTESLTGQYYGPPRDLPLPFTTPLPEKEPHSTAQTAVDPQYIGKVGDPPADPSQGYAGLFNRHNLSEQLLVGGTSQARLYNPMQLSDGHQKLPETPGLIIPERLRSRAKDINLRSIQDELSQHTAHLYHQREMQDLRYATRTLMTAVGNIVRLQVTEQPPPTGQSSVGDPVTTLRIGASTLLAAEFYRPYVGSRYVSVNNTATLFPFGVSIPSGPGAIAVNLGEQGHQFEVSGGRPPYTWTIRRTRSSSNDPARSIDLNGDNQVVFAAEYPFDQVGNPVPDIEWPVTVVGGGLPPGMALNNRGLLYGMPTEAGTFLFRLVCRDRDNRVAEQTIRFYVAGGEGDLPYYEDDLSAADPANFSREDSGLFAKTDIVRASLNPVDSVESVGSWQGTLLAVGGLAPYRWRWVDPKNNPRQEICSTSAGDAVQLSLDGKVQLNLPNESAISQATGLWLWEVEAQEAFPDEPTIDRAPVTLAVGVDLISNFGGSNTDATVETVVSYLPEGSYTSNSRLIDVLVLDPPVPVQHFQDAQNVMLRGTRGHFTRPDLGGGYIGPGPITTINPGVMTPVGVVGVFELGYNVARTQLDFSVGNPTGLWTQIDKFDPQQLGEEGQEPPAPAEDGEIVVEDASILDQTVISKRLRPLWPA